MNHSGIKRLNLFGCGLCGLCLAGAAMAGTSSSRAGITNRDPAELYASRLDLRAPVHLSTASLTNSSSREFPSKRRALSNDDHDDRLPVLGAANEPAERNTGRIETLVRRARREGIPIIRLWDGRAAFVSLGLNQRGVPGLWLIQKIK